MRTTVPIETVQVCVLDLEATKVNSLDLIIAFVRRSSMYPVFRMTKELLLYGKKNSQGFLDEYISSHICWPWDLDVWFELNNGRTLTIFDLGRVTLVNRVGLIQILKDNNWRLTVAGSSVRYRRRVNLFDQLEVRSRIVSWDQKFLYLTQSMWRSGVPTSNVLIRAAIASDQGIVPPVKAIAALTENLVKPEIPNWVKTWIESEIERPWPPT